MPLRPSLPAGKAALIPQRFQYGNFSASIIFFAATPRALVVFLGCVLVLRFAPTNIAMRSSLSAKEFVADPQFKVA